LLKTAKKGKKVIINIIQPVSVGYKKQYTVLKIIDSVDSGPALGALYKEKTARAARRGRNACL
jgi:hypothetical protein